MNKFFIRFCCVLCALSCWGIVSAQATTVSVAPGGSYTPSEPTNYVFSAGTYTVTIVDLHYYGSTSSLQFPYGNTASVINYVSTDAIVTLQWAYNGQVITVNLVGVPYDANIYSIASLNSAYANAGLITYSPPPYTPPPTEPVVPPTEPVVPPTEPVVPPTEPVVPPTDPVVPPITPPVIPPNSELTTPLVPITDPNAIFQNPQDTVVSGGVAVVTAPPTTPLVITDQAPTGAVIAIQTTEPVPIVINQNTLIYTIITTGTILQIDRIGSTPVLEVVTGTAQINAPQTGSTIPITSASGQSVVLQTQQINTQVTAGRDTAANHIVAIEQGRVEYVSTPTQSGAQGQTFIVFSGEAVQTTAGGELSLVRLGSFNQAGGSQPGDFLPPPTDADPELQAPRVSGFSERFNEPLEKVVGRALSNQFGLTSVGSIPLSQFSNGLIAFRTEQGVLRILPIGNIRIVLPPEDRVATADIAANLSEVVAEGIALAVAPATNMSDLNAALRSLEAASPATLQSNGVITGTLNGARYAALPNPVIAATSLDLTPGLIDINGVPALRDRSGAIQSLYPAFADPGQVLTIFRQIDSRTTLSNNYDGSYRAFFSDAQFTLVPDFTLTTRPAGQNGNWWSDNAKFFVSYQDGSVQGFTVR